MNSANADDASMLNAKAVLTADIDMTGINHSPIGPSTTYKFDGEFDGQHHVISNMIIDLPNQENVGLFGLVRGNAVIKNIIIDSSCSIKGKNRVAAIIGCNQTVANKKMAVLNCVNMASVHAYEGVAAGIIGAGQSQYPFFKMHNCVNTGTITTDATDNWTVAFHGWNSSAGGNAQVWSCYNVGTLNSIDGVNNLFRGSNRSVLNSYDLVYTAANMQSQSNIPSGGFKTADPLHSGELCYYLNHGIEMMGRSEETEGEEFTQDLSDPNSIPMPNAAGPKVYQVADLDCAGNPKDGVTYSNTEGGSRDPHNFVNGICSVCGGYEVPTIYNEYYQLDNYGKVKWFESHVNDGHPEYNAELLANINFKGNSCRIGNATYPYKGIFKGNDHVISNFTIDNDQMVQGFFGFITGGADISGLILDNTCSISCTAKAGVIGMTKGSGTVKLTRIGNEGPVTVTKENAAGIIGSDDGGYCVLQIDQCYSTGTIVGGKESAQIAGWTGDNSLISNSWSCAEVTGVQSGLEFSRYGGDNHGAQYENCFTTYHETNTGLTYDTPAAKFASGEVAYTINKTAGKDIFRQTLGEGGDAHPVLDNTHGIVNYISSAGYTTQYIPSTDVTIPTGVEAYAGVISGSAISLKAIETAISKEDAVVLKGSEGYYSFVPTTGVSKAAMNDLEGSDGTVSGGSNIYALAQKGEPAVVGFYPVGSGVTIPAGKAYLEYTAPTPVKGFFGFDDDDATGIEGVQEVQEVQGAIYNIAGQRLDNSQFTIHNSQLKRGIYIVNGKKVLK